MKFSDFNKLCKHGDIFHVANNQKNKGVKRGNDDLEEIS